MLVGENNHGTNQRRLNHSRRVGSRVLELDHRHTHAHSSRRHSTHPGHRRQASSKRGKQLSVNQPLTDSEAKKIFINGAEDFYSLSANPQFSNVAELFDAWLTEHDRQLLAKTETEAGKRISSELKLEHASDAHARTEPSRAYIQGCKAARSLLEDAIRDMTQEQGTLRVSPRRNSSQSTATNAMNNTTPKTAALITQTKTTQTMTPVPTDGNWMETKTTTVRNTGI